MTRRKTSCWKMTTSSQTEALLRSGRPHPPHHTDAIDDLVTRPTAGQTLRIVSPRALGDEGSASAEITTVERKHPIRAVLFDLDGTLIDTMRIYAHEASLILNKYVGIDRDTARLEYLATSGLPFEEQLTLILGEHPLIPKMADEFAKRKECLTRDITLSLKTIDMLKQLREAGMGLAISSSDTESRVADFAKRSAIRFDVAMGYSRVSRKGLNHFEQAACHFSCLLPELLFVGDSLNDARLALQSGVPFVALIGTFQSSDFQNAFPSIIHIDDLTRLPALIR